MVEVMKIMATSFKRPHACTAARSAPNPAGGHRRPMPLPGTPRHSQASLGQSLVGVTAPISWVLVHTSFCLCPPRGICLIPHVHGQRSPSKMVGGAAVVWCLSDFEGKGEAQKIGRRGKTMFRIKPHTRQRCLEGSNEACAHQDPETPQRLRQNCV